MNAFIVSDKHISGILAAYGALRYAPSYSVYGCDFPHRILSFKMFH